ncbi:heavy metal-associated isoprenylated plant protein 12-like isoform X2 [Typha latifolia]|uniref:heavy metal-associated isoprenylated plant protein 12-like isoform X2 n=1 Tax=Typha latifolia TaxID=4733 RepID=UPI003C2F537F
MKIVLKVSILCDKCKTCIMKTVAKLSGIKSLALDVEKCTLTVVGDIDAVLIVKELRKVKKGVDIVSIGPEKEEEKQKEDDKKKEPDCKSLPLCCNTCRPTVVFYDENPNGCIIS